MIEPHTLIASATNLLPMLFPDADTGPGALMRVAAKRRVLMVNATGAIQRRGIWSLVPRKPGALSCAAIEQARVESTRASCRIVHIRRRMCASNFAVPGKPALRCPERYPAQPSRIRPRAPNAWDGASPARAICGSSLLQSEQRLRADLGAWCPFFPCGHDDTQRGFHAAVTAAGSKCIPVGSAASTLTDPVKPRRTTMTDGTDPLIPHRPAQTASSARINNRSRSFIPGA